MRWLADLVYLFASFVYLPVAIYNAVFLRKNRRGWGQRLGMVPRFDPGRRRVWIHAVSLGETNATVGLSQALHDRFPDVELVYSTTTDTGYARAVALYGRNRVFRYPLDFSLVVSHVLRRVNPTLIVLMELEVWPNLVRLASVRRIPVVVVNGRLTEHSARRLTRLAPVTRPMFRRLTWVGAQDETIAGRFRSVGVPLDRIEVTSSLKWDTAAVVDSVPGSEALAAALGVDHSRPLWVCGSTGPGEELVILDAYQRIQAAMSSAPPILAIVPRKPERFDEVARTIQASGFTCLRRTARPDGVIGAPVSAGEVVLGDTMGELRKFYSLADIVFVGRTLVALGGSDSMEVAALAKPLVAGPHHDNFAEALAELRGADAIRIVTTAESLAEMVQLLAGDPALRERMGRAAREAVLRRQGATERTLVGLSRILDSARTANPRSWRRASDPAPVR